MSDIYQELIEVLSISPNVRKVYKKEKIRLNGLSDVDLRQLRHLLKQDIIDIVNSDKYICFNMKDYLTDSLVPHLIAIFNRINFGSIDLYASTEQIIEIKTLLLIYCSVRYLDLTFRDTQTLDEIRNEITNLFNIDKVNINLYFRGVTNIVDYDLLPTMYRGIKGNGVIIDDQTIDNYYEENDLKSSFKKIFKNYNKYDFYAYMQHSISFSPFLDFTEDINIAGSFATQMVNPLNFKNIDSGIYVLFNRNEENSLSQKEHKIELFNEPISYNTFVFGVPFYRLTIDELEVKFNTYKEKSNDRMKYQQGVFLDFVHAVFVNSVLLFPASNTSVIKIRIPYDSKYKLNKDSVINNIELKYPQYKYENLMNPYRWFSKRHNKK